MGNYYCLNLKVTLPKDLKEVDRTAIEWLVDGNDMAKAPADLPDHKFFDYVIGQHRSVFGFSLGESNYEDTEPDWEDDVDYGEDHRPMCVRRLDGTDLMVRSACKDYLLLEGAAEYLKSLGATGYIDLVGDEMDGYTGRYPRTILLDTEGRHKPKPKSEPEYTGFGCR